MHRKLGNAGIWNPWRGTAERMYYMGSKFSLSDGHFEEKEKNVDLFIQPSNDIASLF